MAIPDKREEEMSSGREREVRVRERTSRKEEVGIGDWRGEWLVEGRGREREGKGKGKEGEGGRGGGEEEKKKKL